jgi:hypothetical protein
MNFMFRIRPTIVRRSFSKRLVYKPIHHKKMEDFESGFSFPEIVRIRYEEFELTREKSV